MEIEFRPHVNVGAERYDYETATPRKEMAKDARRPWFDQTKPVKPWGDLNAMKRIQKPKEGEHKLIHQVDLNWKSPNISQNIGKAAKAVGNLFKTKGGEVVPE